jgi:Flp pilus assembly protein TadB
MASLLKNILLTAIALAVLVMVEQWFGMTAAFAGAGVCFIAYILLITLRQMRDEADDE